MIPVEYFASGEIQSTSSNTYVIVLQSKSESDVNGISLKITDADKFLVGRIDNEEIMQISGKLGITDEKLTECFRKAIQEKSSAFNETENQIKFNLVHGTKTAEVTTLLRAVNESDGKPAELKTLILQLARHIKTVEENLSNASNLHAFNPGFGNSILGSQTFSRKTVSKARRLAPGMSIVNPASKRAKSKPGVKFSTASSSDETDS